MKLCKVDNLTGETVLAKDIVSSEYQVLLSANTLLKQEYIDKLKELDIQEVYVEDERQDTYPVVILKKEIGESFRSKIKGILEEHTYSHNEKLVELSQTADRIITNILEEDEVVEKIYDIKERSSDLYEHSISVCSLATIVALKMELPQETVHDIGVSSLLHELGLRYLTVEYENRSPDEMSEEEYEEYKKHPVYGYYILRNENWISNASKNMILYHHERLDGSGYPLKATEISLDCRIIQVCDVFDEMICGIGCERVKVHEAVEYLKKYKGVQYDEEVVNALLEFTAVFPAGTKVKTNEKEEGIVVHQNKQFPDRPVVRVYKDRDGKNVDVVKDLVQLREICIEEVVE